MSDTTSIQQLEISFETFVVPPPYSHTYTFKLRFEADDLQLQYNLEYTHRDELSKEEIWEEGFSNQDDFSWKGSLPVVWCEALVATWEDTHLLSKQEQASSKPLENGLFMIAELTNGQQVTGIPEKIETWEYLLQELTQAVYEAAQREHPLRIRYLKRSSQKEELQLIITIRFLLRSLEVVRQQEKQQAKHTLPWTEVKSMLSTLYQLDYNTEEASAKMPALPGKYLDPGDNRWYQLGKEVTNPGRIDLTDSLRQKLESLIDSY
ncbi:MAG: hypothetical protein WBA23_25265 [Tunicatimonas sp.]|uniref:hypothetical protein n=1 Tax=Tunicatimonas sp. TaxID=1940096 RepID=UPI003C748888